MKPVFAFLASLFAGSADAATDHDPLNYPLRQWGFILLMSLLGGFASWYNKVKRGELAATNLFALVGEFAISALAGLVSFMVCDYFSIPIGLTAAIAGLAGHAGAKGLSIAEVLLQRFAEKKLGIEATGAMPLDDNEKK